MTSMERISRKTLSFSIIAGAVLGLVVEGHTNEIAEGKVITAKTCMEATPHEGKISKKLDECLEAGVPAGQPIGKDKFAVGQPVEFVDGYIRAQANEANSVELDRVLLWTLGGMVVGPAIL